MALLHFIKHSTFLLHFPLAATRFHLSISISFPLKALIWSEKTEQEIPQCRGNFGQRTYSVESLSITVIPSYLGETKTVVKETLILLRCQLCYLKYSSMTTGAAETFLLPCCGCILSFHPLKDNLMCATYRGMEGQSGYRNDEKTCLFQSLLKKTNVTLKSNVMIMYRLQRWAKIMPICTFLA